VCSLLGISFGEISASATTGPDREQTFPRNIQQDNHREVFSDLFGLADVEYSVTLAAPSMPSPTYTQRIRLNGDK